MSTAPERQSAPQTLTSAEHEAATAALEDVNSRLTTKARSSQRRSTTRKRPKQQRETPEYADAVERMIMAYARRVGQGDVEELPRMLEMHSKLDEALGVAVAGLREFGYSWQDIANRTGTSRQAAQQRWGSERDAHH